MSSVIHVGSSVRSVARGEGQSSMACAMLYGAGGGLLVASPDVLTTVIGVLAVTLAGSLVGWFGGSSRGVESGYLVFSLVSTCFLASALNAAELLPWSALSALGLLLMVPTFAWGMRTRRHVRTVSAR